MDRRDVNWAFFDPPALYAVDRTKLCMLKTVI